MSEGAKKGGGGERAYTVAPSETGDIVELDANALPVFCPNPAMTLWSQHPRVYLNLDVTGSAMCPYCGTRYHLAPGSKVRQH